jgi:hypothetical protein
MCSLRFEINFLTDGHVRFASKIIFFLANMFDSKIIFFLSNVFATLRK